MNDRVKRLHGKLIVSCQALPEEPLHSSFIMGRMARAAKMAGAGGIRANTKEDITEIQKEVDLPIIGIVKRDYPDSKVYITPTMKEVDELTSTGINSLWRTVPRWKKPWKQTDLALILSAPPWSAIPSSLRETGLKRMTF